MSIIMIHYFLRPKILLKESIQFFNWWSFPLFLIIQTDMRCNFNQKQLPRRFAFISGHFAEKSGI